MIQWINESMNLIPLPVDSISVVATNGRMITELARLLAFRRPDAKVARAHTVDELPNASGNLAPDALPLNIVNHRRATGDIRAVA